jgi:RNA polymerase sigma-70 factor (ECF subfamily)
VALQLVAPAPEDDATLIAACIRGEASAQRTLFKREYQRVFRTVARLMGSNRDVDDLVQETFVSVFRALGSFRGDAKLSTWIDRIAVRAVFHHLRAKKRTVSLDAVGELEDSAALVEDKAHAREGLRRLYSVLAEMTPDARAAYALYAIDGRTISEVATLTGTTKIAAKLRIWRARREVYQRAESDPILADLVRAGKGQR